MAKPNFHLHLKGYVGGWDFDADYVDFILNKNKDQEVNVLIDSLGGRSDTALSIYAAFKRHGNVNVHFVGMNASAATIASLGAKRITMDRSSMYLVHQCSIEFFKWGMLNADQLQSLIDNIEKSKEDLNKIDANVAEIYASKCKKPAEDLLDLMKKGGWLTSKEALEWGFVDEITEFEDDSAPVLDKVTVQAMADAGIPLPDGIKSQSSFKKFMEAMTEFFYGKKENDINTFDTAMNKNYVNVGAILNCEALEVNEGSITMKEDQMDAIESAIKKDKETIDGLNSKVTALDTEIASLKAQIDALKQKPAEETHQVVEEKKENNAETSAVESFINTRAAAQDLFDMFS